LRDPFLLTKVVEYFAKNNFRRGCHSGNLSANGHESVPTIVGIFCKVVSGRVRGFTDF
jgi:hypothetical protein